MPFGRMTITLCLAGLVGVLLVWPREGALPGGGWLSISGREWVSIRVPQWKSTSASHLQFTPDGRRLIVAALGAGDLAVWSAESGRVLGAWKVRGPGYSMDEGGPVVSPDSTTIYLASQDSSQSKVDLSWEDSFKPKRFSRIRAIDIESGNIRDLEPIAGVIYHLAVSRAGDHVVAGDSHGRVHLWDVRSGRRLRSSQGLGAAVRALAFADGVAEVRTLTMDGVLRRLRFSDLSEAETHQLPRPAVGMACGAESSFEFESYQIAEFSGDGRLLLLDPLFSATEVWNAQSGERVGLVEEARGVQFLDSGTSLAGAVATGGLGIWAEPMGKPISVRWKKWWPSVVTASTSAGLVAAASEAPAEVRVASIALSSSPNW